MHSAVAIANHFIARAQQDDVRDLPATKLHDLVYIAHGWHMGARGKRLFEGAVLASRDGIVLPDLRQAGCQGNRRVTEQLTIHVMDDAKGMMSEQTPDVPAGDAVMPTLVWVWRSYGKQSPYDVSRFTRDHGTPWDLIWNDDQRKDEQARQIPNGVIKAWFREQLKNMPGLGQALGKTAGDNTQTQTVLKKPDPNRLRTV